MDSRKVSQEELQKYYLELSFPEPSEERPYVLVNMVSSFDGSVTVESDDRKRSSEKGLGSKADKKVMKVLRTLSDATLNGASTLRISGSSSEINDAELIKIREARGKSPNPLCVVLSRKGENLPLDPNDPESKFFYSPDFKAVVFVTSEISEARLADLRDTGRNIQIIKDSEDNAREMLSILRNKYQVKVLLCEGGPTVNGSLIKNGLADEFFLTFAPRIVGGGKHAVELRETFTENSLVKLEGISNYFLEETNESFLHYKILS